MQPNATQIRTTTNQATAFLFSSKYFSQQSGCEDVSQSQTTSWKFSLGQASPRAGFEIHASRRRLKAVGSAVPSGDARVTALAPKKMRLGQRTLQHSKLNNHLALLFPEPIAETTHGFNRVAGFAKFFAQPAHMGVDRAGVDYAFVAPDVIE